MEHEIRLIDADALFAEFENVDWYNNADRDEIAERLVLQAPTIDAVSVVRCKECRYKDMEICPMYRLVVAGVRKYDDFCSYGERKESE